MMPFTVDAFFAIFADYNTAIWPLPLLAFLGGIVVVVLLRIPSRIAETTILAILAAMWAVNGIGYHLMHFTAINPAAWLFGGLFVLEAALFGAARFLWPGVRIIAPRHPTLTILAAILFAYALAFYPVLGYLSGHRYPAVPLFGVAPCPTTIFTIGVLLLGNWLVVRWLLIIPVLWSMIGGSAAFLLHVPQDYALLAAGLLALALAISGVRARITRDQ